MRKNLLLIAGLALLVLALPNQSQASTCPALGGATDCDLIITFNADGSVTSNVTGQPPYDGIEDQLVGIVNNSGKTLNSITLAGFDIFGFDGDGQQSFTGTFYGTDTTGYAGPNTSFSVVDNNNGSVSFTGGLASGSTAWFTLEQAATAQGGGVTVVGAPEPSALLLLGSGLIPLFGFARRRFSI